MTVRRVNRRERAQRDIDEAAGHYLEEGGDALALRFIDALEAAFSMSRSIRPPGAALCHPNQYARPALLAGEAFPPSDFYVEREDHVDVWRVLHGQRDIPAWLQIEE